MNYQCDSFGILHHARYLELMEEARWLYFHENKLMDAFHERGIYHVIVNINIDYKGSARFGDAVTLETEVSRTSEKSVVFSHNILCRGHFLAQAQITDVFMETKNHNVVPVAAMTDFWEDIQKF